MEVSGGVRGSSLDADLDNPPGTAYPDEAALPENEDPPVVEDSPNSADLATFAEVNPELDQVAYLPFVSTEGTDGTQTVQAFAVAAPNATYVVKYYFFGGQRIAPFDSAQDMHESQRLLPLPACIRTIPAFASISLGSTVTEINTAATRTKQAPNQKGGDNLYDCHPLFVSEWSSSFDRGTSLSHRPHECSGLQ